VGCRIRQHESRVRVEPSDIVTLEGRGLSTRKGYSKLPRYQKGFGDRMIVGRCCQPAMMQQADKAGVKLEPQQFVQLSHCGLCAGQAAGGW
jgi:hypothetical protein